MSAKPPTRPQPSPKNRIPDSVVASTPAGRRYNAVAALILVAVVVALFARTIGFEFLHWDDLHHIVENPRLASLTTEHLWQIWSAPYFEHYVPLSYTLFLVEGRIGAWLGVQSPTAPFDPHIFHAVCVLLHAVNTLLVFRLLSRLIPNAWAALAGALVFAVHPLQVESVAWISETRGLLCALLSLLAIDAYLSFAMPRPSPDGPSPAAEQSFRRPWYYGCSLMLFLLAILAKPSAAALPLVIAAIDWLLLKRDWKHVAVALGPWLLVSLLFMLVTKSEQRDELIDVIAPLWVRPIVALDIVAFYLGKLFWPWPLAVDYGWRVDYMRAQWWFYGLGLVPCVIGAILAWPRSPAAARAGAGIFVAAIAPVLGLVPFGFQSISSVADRYVYLSMFGVSLIVAALVARFWNRVVIAGFAVGVVLLAVVAFKQTSFWHDDRTLFVHAMSVHPESWTAATHIGSVELYDKKYESAAILFRRAIQLQPYKHLAYINLAGALYSLGLMQPALESANRAVELSPTAARAQNMLGQVLQHMGRIPEAITAFRRAVKLQPEGAEHYTGLAIALAQAGQLQEAEQNYRIALKLRPGLIEAEYNLANLLLAQRRFDEAALCYRATLAREPRLVEAYCGLGNILLQRGDYAGAIREYQAALRLQPKNWESRYNVANAWVELGKPDEAIREFRVLIADRPNQLETYHALAQAYLRCNQDANAIAEYQTALRIKSDWPVALMWTAWIYATSPDPQLRNGPEALRLAREANRVTGERVARVWDVQAAAEAETGDYAAAVASAKRAIELAQTQKIDSLAADIATRLALYSINRPFRESRPSR